MNVLSRMLPGIVIALAGGFLVVEAMPYREASEQMHLADFGRIPVVDGGRVKPIDTLARTSLLMISNRQTLSEDGRSIAPVQWLLDVMTSQLSDRSPADKFRVFRIENIEVLNMLGLERRYGFRYAIEEFGTADKMARLQERAEEAQKRDPKERDVVDANVIELAQRLQLYIDLARWQNLLIVPPAKPDEEWKSMRSALVEEKSKGGEDRAFRSIANIILAYTKGETSVFNDRVAEYHHELEQRVPDLEATTSFEAFFNHFAPFYQCSLLYVAVFMLVCGGWLTGMPALNRSAFWLALLTFAVHTWALGARMYIQGRPPVTNLYSSAIFIGWGCVLFGLVLERMFPTGVGNAITAMTGSLSLVVAHHLASSGDTLQMMQAVLDTNFWLATHVVCVNLGYTATFVAGFLGILYIFRGLLTRSLDRGALKSLGQMMYGVVCFALFFSFTGTVLGGIWADQSWGRFWGWDPKENGALLIVLSNALILHARWGGMVKQRGMAVLAVAGNMVTGWSYFGTNQLGVGLHAYGFNNTLAIGLTVFWATQLLIIALGLVPVRFWRSASAMQAPRPMRPSSPVAAGKPEFAPVAT
jgi:ABC-type transport system involved in cytochrome c biogenesis permease subunit